MKFESKLEKTLLIPLWSRVKEAESPDPIVVDQYSIDFAKKLGEDLSFLEGAWQTQLAVSIRTKIFLDQVSLFLKKNPEANVVNLACGLDTYFLILDNGNVHWYDIDFPGVIDKKAELVKPCPRHHLVKSSIFDLTWFDLVENKDLPTLVMAEGILFYLEKNDVRNLVSRIADAFPKVDYFLELIGTGMVHGARYNESIKCIGYEKELEFRWGLFNSKAIEKWDKRLKLEEEWWIADYYSERWGKFRKLFKNKLFKKLFSNKIIHAKNYRS